MAEFLVAMRHKSWKESDNFEDEIVIVEAADHIEAVTNAFFTRNMPVDWTVEKIVKA